MCSGALLQLHGPVRRALDPDDTGHLGGLRSGNEPSHKSGKEGGEPFC